MARNACQQLLPRLLTSSSPSSGPTSDDDADFLPPLDPSAVVGGPASSSGCSLSTATFSTVKPEFSLDAARDALFPLCPARKAVRLPFDVPVAARRAIREAVVALFGGRPPEQRGHPGIAVQVILPGHVPACLVGQRGVRNCSGSVLPANTLLGEFGGLLMRRYEFETLYHKDMQANDYAFDLDVDGRAYTLETWHHGTKLLEFANDYRTDLLDCSVGLDRLNAQFVQAEWRGQPRVLVVTTRDVQPGEWIQVDYGKGYWRGFWQRRGVGDSDECPLLVDAPATIQEKGSNEVHKDDEEKNDVAMQEQEDDEKTEAEETRAWLAFKRACRRARGGLGGQIERIWRCSQMVGEKRDYQFWEIAKMVMTPPERCAEWQNKHLGSDEWCAIYKAQIGPLSTTRLARLAPRALGKEAAYENEGDAAAERCGRKNGAAHGTDSEEQ